MKKNTFIKLSVAVLMVVTITCALAETTEPPSYIALPATPEEEVDAQELWRILDNLNIAAVEAGKAGRIKGEDFELLEFDQPEDAGYGDNIDYEVFHLDSPRKFAGFEGKALFAEDFLDRVTTVRGTKVLYTLRRDISDNGRIVDRFYLVIPNMKEGVCAWRGKGKPFIKGVSNLSVMANDEREIILEKENSSLGNVCVKDSNGTLYRLSVMFVRLRQPGTEKWIVTQQTLWGLVHSNPAKSFK